MRATGVGLFGESDEVVDRHHGKEIGFGRDSFEVCRRTRETSDEALLHFGFLVGREGHAIVSGENGKGSELDSSSGARSGVEGTKDGVDGVGRGTFESTDGGGQRSDFVGSRRRGNLQSVKGEAVGGGFSFESFDASEIGSIGHGER